MPAAKQIQGGYEPSRIRHRSGTEGGVSNYKTTMLALIVKPPEDPIFSEMATVIEMMDEAAGPYVRVKQSRGDGDGCILVECEEWPHIREAIDRMIAECRKANTPAQQAQEE